MPVAWLVINGYVIQPAVAATGGGVGCILMHFGVARAARPARRFTRL